MSRAVEIIVQYFSQSPLAQNHIGNHCQDKDKLTEIPEAQNCALKAYNRQYQLSYIPKALSTTSLSCGTAGRETTLMNLPMGRTVEKQHRTAAILYRWWSWNASGKWIWPEHDWAVCPRREKQVPDYLVSVRDKLSLLCLHLSVV